MVGNESRRLDCRVEWRYAGLACDEYRRPEPERSHAPLAGAGEILAAILDAGGSDVSIAYAQAEASEGYPRANEPLPESLFGVPVRKTKQDRDSFDSVVFRFSLGVPAPPRQAWILTELAEFPPAAPVWDSDEREESDGEPELKLYAVPDFRPAFADDAIWGWRPDPWEPGAAAEFRRGPKDSWSAAAREWREAFFKKAAATLCGGDPKAYLAFARIARGALETTLRCLPGFDGEVAEALKNYADGDERK